MRTHLNSMPADSMVVNMAHRAPQHRLHDGAEWHDAQADARALTSSLDPVRFFKGIVVVGDAIVIGLACAVASLIRFGLVFPMLHVGTAASLAILIMFKLMHGGTVDARETTARLSSQLIEVLRSWTLTIVMLLVAAYLLRISATYPRLWVALWFAIGLTGLSLVRIFAVRELGRWRRQGRFARMVAVVDLDGTGHVLAQQLQHDSTREARLLGVFSASAVPPTPGTRVSSVDDLIALSQLFRIDDVVVTTSWPGSPMLQETLRKLSSIPTTVRLCPLLPPAFVGPHCQAELMMGNPTLVVCRRPLPGWDVVFKRLEDLILGCLMLAALSPVMLLIAASVRLDSPGPALFRQKRLGFNNNPITVYKFRSMVHRPIPDDAEVIQASRNDQRVTRLGRYLRKSSLDELPQLFNVLRGEMSLVGPRPHAIAHNAQYAALIDDYLGRHRVQPGITGWAQVNGLRGETDTLEKMQKRIEFDLAYIQRWSLMFDLRIIIQTAFGVLFHRQAY
ncbi:undecaprenyl-phosphate glucose phosphotransferase [Lichenicola cladoniae]|uniref:Undecaprenyl-phosphate glucose phosphotransferase n=1 Tax=Lichenicola cladoniae TaxID=1484109 RepID=A0A6M8HTR4_9PROT|nr:undecaprenyl-phosphate glucose phosphotransferase [Lichenicola cladoniae]NPD67626.1 undecaprenyl-phosphate glucose phosphotransferase [Acetobacteraceae bacterium]QKE91732.1 undecaprenyl-phosphate glucose phosphotransferase [Lichenicola cladoniae]